PVAHSRSPRMQNAALRAAGIPLVYEALDVPPAGLDAALDALIAEGAAGNVTSPHKMHVAQRCDVRLPSAERTGAVNTFWTADGALIGDNTDVEGFDAAVQHLLGTLPTDIDVGVFGAGGAAAGVLAAIERWGRCRVRVYNRTAARAEALARRFPTVATAVSSPGQTLAGAALAVNATPRGLYDDALAFPIELLDPRAIVVDLAYRRDDTALVRAARAQGHAAADGHAMLVGQGARAFECWFGVAPDRGVMWEALRQTD
ncbi:MAG: shikimate dehydrogenase, partial [Gemmatimonadaceae bacterium]